MKRRNGNCPVALLLSAALAGSIWAQAPSDSDLTKRDLAESRNDRRNNVGPGQGNSSAGAPSGNKPDDPVFEPVKIFDNVYAIGRTGTAVYAITTSAGILLIDSGYERDVEPVLLDDGMKKLGLDPAQIKTIIITHDSSITSRERHYLQQHYHPAVYLSQPDWDLMERPGGGEKRVKARSPRFEARSSHVRWPGDHAGRRESYGRFHPGSHAWIDGPDLPGEGPRQDARRRDFRRHDVGQRAQRLDGRTGAI